MKLATDLSLNQVSGGARLDVYYLNTLVDSYMLVNVEQEAPTLTELVEAVKRAMFEFDHLKPFCLAQWILESGRGTSVLFREHRNAGGMKWREEMKGLATSVEYKAHDGTAYYCSFESLEKWILGYWRFIERSVYAGWREAAKKGGEEFIRFLAVSGYAQDPEYVKKVLALVPEARSLLGVEEDTSEGGLLDPGHSELEPGAHSKKGAEEENLNLLQAELVQEHLSLVSIKSEIFNPDVDNLTEIGLKAKGKRFFVSFHHNSYEGDGNPGTEVYVTREARPQDVKLAEKVVKKICSVLGTTNRGVKFKDYTVIANASSVCDGPCVLVESYFIQPFDMFTASKMSSLAARAIADALIEVL